MSICFEQQRVNDHQAQILIVDDDATLRTLIRTRLLKHGYTVIEAKDGYEAISVFSDSLPDIVLMDANMPEMDGFEATRELKKMPEAKDTPILMVSGLEDDESVDRAFSLGATEYITKPICWPLLTHRLANICTAMSHQASILKAKADADRANQCKSEFLDNMSHELRTPMHAILSFAAMGVGKVQSAERGKLSRYFSRIEQSGKRLLNLLNDLLDLSKLESRAIDCDIKKGDMQQVVDTVVIEMSGLVTDRGVKLVVQAPEVPTDAMFDSERMMQVVRNLVGNAVKFTPEGKVITLSYGKAMIAANDEHEEKTALLFTVADQGVGIPDQELEDVFNKFVQSSKTKTGAGGTGLGLSISREIIIQHGGAIVAKNNSDGGASFYLTLPYAS